MALRSPGECHDVVSVHRLELKFERVVWLVLVAEFISTDKVYTFKSIRVHMIPNSLRCTHSFSY